MNEWEINHFALGKKFLASAMCVRFLAQIFSLSAQKCCAFGPLEVSD